MGGGNPTTAIYFSLLLYGKLCPESSSQPAVFRYCKQLLSKSRIMEKYSAHCLVSMNAMSAADLLLEQPAPNLFQQFLLLLYYKRVVSAGPTV